MVSYRIVRNRVTAGYAESTPMRHQKCGEMSLQFYAVSHIIWVGVLVLKALQGGYMPCVCNCVKCTQRPLTGHKIYVRGERFLIVNLTLICLYPLEQNISSYSCSLFLMNRKGYELLWACCAVLSESKVRECLPLDGLIVQT